MDITGESTVVEQELTREEACERNRADIALVSVFGKNLERLDTHLVNDYRLQPGLMRASSEPAGGRELVSINIHAHTAFLSASKRREEDKERESRSLISNVTMLEDRIRSLEAQARLTNPFGHGPVIPESSYREQMENLQKEIDLLTEIIPGKAHTKSHAGKINKLNKLKLEQKNLLAAFHQYQALEKLKKEHELINRQLESLKAENESLKEQLSYYQVTEQRQESTMYQQPSLQEQGEESVVEPPRDTPLSSVSVAVTTEPMEVESESQRPGPSGIRSYQSASHEDTRSAAVSPEFSDDQSGYHPQSDEESSTSDEAPPWRSPAPKRRRTADALSAGSTRTTRKTRGKGKARAVPRQKRQTQPATVRPVSESSNTDFEKSMTAREIHLMHNWLQRKHSARQEINSGVRKKDERTIKLLIFMSAIKCKKSSSRIAEHLTRIGFEFPQSRRFASESYRDYVRQIFSNNDAAQILRLYSSVPEELKKGTATKTRSVSVTLLENIKDNTDAAHESLVDYLSLTFYGADRIRKDDSHHPFRTALDSLRTMKSVLGTPVEDVDKSWIYQFMVNNNIFKPGDADFYVPPDDIACQLLSEDQFEEGKRRLDRHVLQLMQRRKTIEVIPPLLQGRLIPNVIRPGHPWTLNDVEKLPSMEIFLASQAEESLEEIVQSWLNSKKGSASKLRRCAFSSGINRLGEVAKCLRQKHDFPVSQIANLLRTLNLSSKDISTDNIRETMYKLSSDESMEVQSSLLEGVIHVFLARAKQAYLNNTRNSLDSQFTKSDYESLTRELREKMKNPRQGSCYLRYWSVLLREYPFQAVHRLYLREKLKTMTPTRLQERLSEHNTCRFPSTKTYWTIQILFKHLLDHDITDIICSNDEHIAVLMAARGFDMSNIMISGRNFTVFLDTELKRHQYSSEIRKKLIKYGHLSTGTVDQGQ